MTTCQECGADAVNRQGICQNCGARAQRDGAVTQQARTHSMESDSGATREATSALGDGARPLSPRAPINLPGGGSGLFASPAQATPPPRFASPAAPATESFCLTCGARLEPGRPFCGQCGAPTAASSAYSAELNGPPYTTGRYQAAQSLNWTPEDQDAQTVVDLPVGGFGGGRGGGSSNGRTLRIVLGVLCLLASLVTAIAAILMAIATFAPA